MLTMTDIREEIKAAIEAYTRYTSFTPTHVALSPAAYTDLLGTIDRVEWARQTFLDEADVMVYGLPAIPHEQDRRILVFNEDSSLGYIARDYYQQRAARARRSRMVFGLPERVPEPQNHRRAIALGGIK